MNLAQQTEHRQRGHEERVGEQERSAQITGGKTVCGMAYTHTSDALSLLLIILARAKVEKDREYKHNHASKHYWCNGYCNVPSRLPLFFPTQHHYHSRQNPMVAA